MNRILSPKPYLIFLGLLFLALSSSKAVPNFTKEDGVRITTATPHAITGTFPGARMYFIRDFQVRSATSADGLTWSEESGVRVSTSTTPTVNVSSITGCAVLPLDTTGFRMLYSVIDSSGNFRIHVATSSDGLSWANSTGTVIEVSSGTTFVGFPTLVELSNGHWRAYYIQDNNGGNNTNDYQIFSSSSVDEGVNWSSSSVALAELAGEVGSALLTDSRVRLFYTAPLTGQTTNTQILSAVASATDGTSFTTESGVRLSTDASTGRIAFPLVVRSTDTFRWRVYYGYVVNGSTTPEIRSGVTIDPDVQSLSPTVVFQTDPAATFTIRGEVFSSTPTAMLTNGANTINGTSLSRGDDLTITVTFNTNGQAFGFWDLTVTNSDGRTSTLSRALQIDFPAGSVTLTDNLMRPRLSQSTQIDLTTFTAGLITVRIYTLDGKEVRTIVNEQRNAGSHTFLWDGRTDNGNLVASGVYAIYIDGPKIEQIQKVVVIK